MQINGADVSMARDVVVTVVAGPSCVEQCSVEQLRDACEGADAGFYVKTCDKSDGPAIMTLNRSVSV